MDTSAAAVLAVLMRWIHIICMAVMVGGLIYARFAFAPALGGLAEGAERERVSDRAAASFRGLLLGAIIGSLGSGLYNFITKASYPPGYHALFGIKMLLVLHIFAVAFLLATRPLPSAKRARLATGVVASGTVVLLLSAILRYLTQQAGNGSF